MDDSANRKTRLTLSAAAVAVLAALTGVAVVMHDGGTVALVGGMLALSVQNFLTQFPSENAAASAKAADVKADKAAAKADQAARATTDLIGTLTDSREPPRP